MNFRSTLSYSKNSLWTTPAIKSNALTKKKMGSDLCGKGHYLDNWIQIIRIKTHIYILPTDTFLQDKKAILHFYTSTHNNIVKWKPLEPLFNHIFNMYHWCCQFTRGAGCELSFTPWGITMARRGQNTINLAHLPWVLIIQLSMRVQEMLLLAWQMISRTDFNLLSCRERLRWQQRWLTSLRHRRLIFVSSVVYIF